jgi:hypothetical protein
MLRQARKGVRTPKAINAVEEDIPRRRAGIAII